jgi:hypothetical protein
MSERTKRRHRQLRRQGKEVREAGKGVVASVEKKKVVLKIAGKLIDGVEVVCKPALNKNGRQRIVAGRRNAMVARCADTEARGFIGAVFAAIERREFAASRRAPVLEMRLKTYAEGIGTWLEPSRSLAQSIGQASFPPALLAIATWDALPIGVYEQPHGKRMTAGAFKSSGGEPSRLTRWAWGLEPIREGNPRRGRPPQHLLNVSKRMMSYWRHHPDYLAAREFVSALCRRVIPANWRRNPEQVADDFHETVTGMFEEFSSGAR